MRLGIAITRSTGGFVYVYDYGDNWRHEVIVEEVRDGDPEIEYPAIHGRRPAVSAGRCRRGPDGFTDFLEAILDPAHEEHRAMLDWYGGPFDPSDLDEAAGPVSAWRTWRGGGAARSPATGADRGVPSNEPGRIPDGGVEFPDMLREGSILNCVSTLCDQRR